jgi:hypothetical protein
MLDRADQAEGRKCNRIKSAIEAQERAPRTARKRPVP